jgi:hypothetical protein
MANANQSQQNLTNYLEAVAKDDKGVIRALELDVWWGEHYPVMAERMKALKEHFAAQDITSLMLMRRYYPEPARCIHCGQESTPLGAICEICYLTGKR